MGRCWHSVRFRPDRGRRTGLCISGPRRFPAAGRVHKISVARLFGIRLSRAWSERGHRDGQADDDRARRPDRCHGDAHGRDDRHTGLRPPSTSIGGSAITRYEYRQQVMGRSRLGELDRDSQRRAIPRAVRNVTVSSATDSYTYQLRAANSSRRWSVDRTPADAITPETPGAGRPARPLTVSVTAHATTTPGSIRQGQRRFRVGTPSPTSVEFRASTDSGVNWSCAVTDRTGPTRTVDSRSKELLAGLTPGTAYTFEVRGRNAFAPRPRRPGVRRPRRPRCPLPGWRSPPTPRWANDLNDTGEDVVATLTFSRPVTFAEVGGKVSTSRRLEPLDFKIPRQGRQQAGRVRRHDATDRRGVSPTRMVAGDTASGAA